MHLGKALLACALSFVGGCTDGLVAVGPEDGTTGTPGAETSSADSTSTGSSQPSDETSSTAGSTSTAADDESDSSGTTGEPTPGATFDLVVQRDIAGDPHLYTLRVVDGVSEPLVRLHSLDVEREWGYPQFLSGGRVLVESRRQEECELHVADLADPAHSTLVGVADEPPGLRESVYVLPDERLLYGREGTAHRVTLDGTDVVETVPLIPYGGPFDAAIDPLGRYVIVRSANAENTLRLSLDDLVATPIPDSDFVPLLTVDGSAGFRSRMASDGALHLEYVPLAEGVGTPVDLLPSVMPGTLAEFLPTEIGIRPRADLPGFALSIVGSDPSVDEMSYIGIVDGLPLAPLPFEGPQGAGGGSPHGPWAGEAWSPDGRWLAFETYAEEGYEVWLADFANGHEATLTQLDEAGPEWWPNFEWAADSSALYVGHWGNPPRTQRVVLTEGEPVLQSIGPDDASTKPLALSPDGTMLLYRQWDDGIAETSLYLVDVSGDSPGRPTLIASTKRGEGTIDRADFSPDGRAFVYGSDLNLHADTPLMLVLLDGRDASPVEVSDALDWWFAPNQD